MFLVEVIGSGRIMSGFVKHEWALEPEERDFQCHVTPWRLVCDDTQVTGYDISRGIDGRDSPLFCGWCSCQFAGVVIWPWFYLKHSTVSFLLVVAVASGLWYDWKKSTTNPWIAGTIFTHLWWFGEPCLLESFTEYPMKSWLVKYPGLGGFPSRFFDARCSLFVLPILVGSPTRHGRHSGADERY